MGAGLSIYGGGVKRASDRGRLSVYDLGFSVRPDNSVSGWAALGGSPCPIRGTELGRLGPG
jgi:hypothetical protein